MIAIGRPRAFDEKEALHRAMLVFWRYGYESSSMALLAREMDMSPPSIYAAYGDKKDLFLKALDLYVGDLKALKSALEKAPTAYAATHDILKASAERFTQNKMPKGCMLASATASCSLDAADVHAESSKKRAAIEKIILDRIDRDVAAGLIGRGTSTKTLAALAVVIIQGMSVLARDGASRKKLLEIAEASMLAWPA